MEKNDTSLSKGRVVLGMSGGVDSSVALVLLKKAGYEVIGVSLKYDTWKCSRKENVCCSKESFELAKKIASSNNCEHHILDVRKEFSREVIEYFKSELTNNRTPSPCVFCNPKVKFLSLIHFADKIKAKFIATGHYARTGKADVFSRKQIVLRSGRDLVKDQSYSLSFLNNKILERTIFPLGNLTKQEVYKIAKASGMSEFYSKIKQSQDFCFVSSSDYPKFVKKEIAPVKGPIIDKKTNKLGEHEGLAFYTIGQRKGIKLPGGPYYVVDKKSPNILVVSREKSDSYLLEAVLKPFNLIVTPNQKCIDVMVRTRSSEKLNNATVEINRNYLKLVYPQKISQLVPGQVAVFYQGDICLGAGVINSS